MAQVTLRTDRFPAGTAVSAYKRLDFTPVPIVPAGVPSGPVAVSTQVVGADGSLTFTGLADDTKYLAYAQVGGQDRYVQFRSKPVGDGADQPDGSVQTAGAGAVASWSQALEKIATAAYGDADLLVPAPYNNLFSANGVVGATNRLNLVRCIAPKSGTLRNLYVCVAAVAASGTFEASVFDVNGSRKWTEGQVAATGLAAGWNKVGDPNIPVDAGEPVFLSWLNPENTLSVYRYPIGNVIGADMPFDLIPEGNGKLTCYLPGQTSVPAFADPNSYVASTLVWAIAGVIV